MDNYQRVTRGFQILTELLAPYVAQQLQQVMKENWWKYGVLDILFDDQKRDLPASGDYAALVDKLDAARCLLLIDLNWNNVFKLRLSREHRNWVKELSTTRNKWAHKGSGDFDDADAWRALDTMARLMEQIDADATEELRSLARQVRYGTADASTTAAGTATQAEAAPADRAAVLTAVPRAGLTPWRHVIEPHPDVAQGRYRQAEFAANLADVLRGKAEIEYQDPVEFFARTYVTEGMRGLLQQAVNRVSGRGGEPVIQLKTAFGGGKTHSMLALFHLMRSGTPIDRIPNARAVLERAGLAALPKTCAAVLVGTALNPSKPRRPINFPGITIRTLWGELAAQLADQCGDPKVYDFIKDSDRTGVSPGSETLREMLDACGPCLILMDEMVAYVRKIYGVADLPSGSYDSVMSFMQELTEAVRASKNSLLVASIPESDIEAGGDIGKQALERIEHIFGRMEAIWKPVGAEEGFAIVRQRLFLRVKDKAAMEETCRAYSEMYVQGASDFPTECRELNYLERLRACYPIHPEVFDRLYNEWAGLERFQKTRGVLRLMAAVIHHLWIGGDAGLLLMPGSIPLDSIPVREELTRHLPEGWNNIVERDVDGRRSLPHQIDGGNPRFGQCMAARRVARTIFLGSAPSVREMRNRGIEDVRIRLGVVQPGESVALFNDGLRHLENKLTYLYAQPPRYWYDITPTLRRTVEDRAQQVSAEEVEMELERRLKGIRERGEFAAVHTCPASSLDVPDEPTVRLVVLEPSQRHRHGNMESTALTTAKEILDRRGTAPRIYRNMLAFVAPEMETALTLEKEVRLFLAWQSVVKDEDALNLDAHQRREAATGKSRTDQTVDLRLKEAYIWLLVPTQDGTGPVEWETFRLAAGGESHVVKASARMKQAEQLISRWAPALLRMELDKWLWKDVDHIQIKKLWEYLASYCYLPRLKDQSVLSAAIADGLGKPDYFGYAAGVTETGKYLELGFADAALAGRVVPSGWLVRPDVAKRELDAIRAEREAEADAARRRAEERRGGAGETTIVVGGGSQGGIGEAGGSYGGRQGDDETVHVVPTTKKKIRRFHASFEAEALRLSRDGDQIAREVLQHLNALVGANVKVTLEISAEFAGDVPESTVRTVTENCRTLKFKDHGFEEE
jgi:hypothetical protein